MGTMKRGVWAAGLLLVGVTAWSAAQDKDATPPDEARERNRPATSQPAPMEPKREPSAEDVLNMLTPKEGVAQPIVRPDLPSAPRPTTIAPEGQPRNAIVPVDTKLLPDGYRIVDRPGRLQREGDYWIYAFESRSTQRVEPPMRLLPNRALEDMEITSAGGTRGVVFLVSGEVTEYHGVNYLLVQKMLIRPNMGNLR